MHKRGGGGVLRSRVPAKRDIWRNLLGSFVVIAGHLSWPYGLVILDKRQAGPVCRAEGVRWRRRRRPSNGGTTRRVSQEDATTIDSESKCGINVYARSHLNNSCTRISAWQLINKIKFIFTYAELCRDGNGDCWRCLLRSCHHHHQHFLRRMMRQPNERRTCYGPVVRPQFRIVPVRWAAVV